MIIKPLLSDRVDSSQKMSSRPISKATNDLNQLQQDCVEAPAGSGCAKESKEVEKNDKKDKNPSYSAALYSQSHLSGQSAYMLSCRFEGGCEVLGGERVVL